MADDKLYRFKPVVQTFYGARQGTTKEGPADGKMYRTNNQYGKPDYLDISVPMAPNHHFTPVGEVVNFKGHTNLKRSELLEEVHLKLESIEAEMKQKDIEDGTTKGKVFWMEAFKIMEEKKINDPAKVLEALKLKEKKDPEKK
jgi:hypothetical protein